jgi:hypothetical protein
MPTWNGTFVDTDLFASNDTAPNLFLMFVKAYNERAKACGITATWPTFDTVPNFANIKSTTQSGNQAIQGWRVLQGSVIQLAQYFLQTVDNTGAAISFSGFPANATNATNGFFLDNPLLSWYSAYMAGGSHFPNATGWTRKYPREIRTLSQGCLAGSTGHIARLIVPTPTKAPGDVSSFTNRDPAWDGVLPLNSTTADWDSQGKYFQWSGTAWVPAPLATYSDIITTTGTIQSGDLVGPWIANDIRDALNLMTVTFGVPDFGTVGALSLLQLGAPWPVTTFKMVSAVPATPASYSGSGGSQAAAIASWALFASNLSPEVYNSQDFSGGISIVCGSGQTTYDLIPVAARPGGGNVSRTITPYYSINPQGFPDTFFDFNTHGWVQNVSNQAGAAVIDANNTSLVQPEWCLNAAIPGPPWAAAGQSIGWHAWMLFSIADWGQAVGGFDFSVHT